CGGTHRPWGWRPPWSSGGSPASARWPTPGSASSWSSRTPKPGCASRTPSPSSAVARRCGRAPPTKPATARRSCTPCSGRRRWMASEDADDLPGAKDIEDLSRARLAPEGRAELFAEQTECVLSFLEDGLPTAVVLSYLVDEHGHFWFATVEGRRQVRGVDADPRVAVVVSSAGTGL